MNKLIKQLKEISKRPTEKLAKRSGINVGDLISKGLIERYVETTNKYLIPEGAPRWAVKFRYSRKKHGIEEHIVEETYLRLTSRGSMKIKNVKKDDEVEEPKIDKEDDDQEVVEFTDE